MKEKIDEFFVSLAETIAWCSRPDVGSDPKNSLRLIEPNNFYLESREGRVYSVKLKRNHHLLRAGVKKLGSGSKLTDAR